LLKNKPRPTMKEVEDAFDTTICRCTGYRAILDGMKSFATDAPNPDVIDIEEMGVKLCSKNGLPCTNLCDDIRKLLHIGNKEYQWLRPANLTQLTSLLKQYSKQKYRLVFGNTGFGVFKELAVKNFDILIDIRGVNELYTVDLDEEFYLTLGANLTLTNLKELFENLTDSSVPYAKEFADHLLYVASTGVRNLGSWAGNLMLKYSHKEFPSDIFLLLSTVGVTLNIVDEKGSNKNYSMVDFLSLNMTGKVIVSMQLPKYKSQNIVIRTFKTSPRLQQSLAYISSGFNFQIDISNNYLIKTKPVMTIQGIGPSLIHASQTEQYLTNKSLADPLVIKEAFRILSTEVQKGSESLVLASLVYRSSLAIGHFYKFILRVCKDKVDARFLSGGLDLERPVSSGTHDYGTQDESIFPVSKPMMKLTATHLTKGEIKFVTDLPSIQGQLYAAVVLSARGNAKIEKIDASAALAIKGVIAFVQASDIPGINNWRPLSVYPVGSELLSSGFVGYAGQPLGVVIAETQTIALDAAEVVQVRYTEIRPVIVDILDAIAQKSFFERLGPFTKGDAKVAMESAPRRLKGSTRTEDQYHFQLENQAATCTPTDLGGMDVVATSQWISGVQETVAQVLGIQQASVKVETQRLGGAFGSKIVYNMPVAGMAAVAAHKVKRPVTLTMDLKTNMQFQGKREGYYYEYEVGFDDDGKLLAIIATAYGDGGAEFQIPESNELTEDYVDNAYFCPNWSWTFQPCKTNKPVITPMRAVGSATAIFAMESMLDHVATHLKKDHLEVRKVNFFKDGQSTLAGLVLNNTLTRQVVQQLEKDIQYAERKQRVEDFNKANRWRKKGLHVMPARYAFLYTILRHNTSVIIYHGDATVSIAHGGIDIGQGINTKAVQTCAYKLGISMDKIKVATSSTVINANSDFTGGSTTTDLICNAVIKCCDTLNARLEATRKSLTNPSWEELIRKAFVDGVNLTAQYWPEKPLDFYNSYIAACAEVELDVLTGQYQITQEDYIYDCGISMNPELDLGQVEGGFIQGCGMFLLENIILDPNTSKALTDSTNTYKPPLPKDIPIKLNVKFLRNAPNPTGVLGSKIVGESGVVQGACPLFALKRAIEAARAEAGQEGWFPFYAPAKVERIQQACLNDISSYTLGTADTSDDSYGCTSH
ncbi:unnamed protein product, partial [Candidula unifasciata]